MVNNVTFGQYFPGNSLIHRTDPRVKILLLITFIVLMFCAFNFVSLGLVTLATFAVVILSKVPVKMYLKSLKVILIIVLLTSVLNLFYGSGEPLWQWGVLKITWEGISRSIFVTIRIFCLILISSALTFTTSPTDLTDALESLMKPLNVFHIKVHEIAMMMSIALRFIPTLLEETDKISQAQKARGADMDSGNIVQRVKAFIPILIPLFVSSFRRAFELAMAMECRCYQGGNGRTRMKTLHTKPLDYVMISATSLILTGVVLCNIFFPMMV